ncbi:MAG: YvrJ family protein [Paraclostridium sordellii]
MEDRTLMELDLMQLVSNLGFSAIVTMYLLIRIEGKLENLSTSINSLSSNINELNNKN